MCSHIIIKQKFRDSMPIMEKCCQQFLKFDNNCCTQKVNKTASLKHCHYDILNIMPYTCKAKAFRLWNQNPKILHESFNYRVPNFHKSKLETRTKMWKILILSWCDILNTWISVRTQTILAYHLIRGAAADKSLFQQRPTDGASCSSSPSRGHCVKCWCSCRLVRFYSEKQLFLFCHVSKL